MTVDTIEANIAKGRGIAARVLGRTFWLYRPVSAFDPITPVSLVTTLPCLFTPQPDAYHAPNRPAQPWWFGEFDTRLTQPGDVFSGSAGVWFLFSQQQYTAPLCVGTNRVISVLLPQKSAVQDGANGYSGTTATNSITILSGWPASVLLGTKGGAASMRLPGDTRSPWWSIMLPPTLGIDIPHGAIITDDLGRQFSVSASELTDAWRITAQQDVT